MKRWPLFYFLVLTVLPFCGGQEEHLASPENQDGEGEGTTIPMTTLLQTLNEWDVNYTNPTPESTTLSESVNATDAPATDITSPTNAETAEEGIGTTPALTPSSNEPGIMTDSAATTTVTMATRSAPSSPATTSSPTWAYLLMVVIVIVIIALCVILLCLRRASRTYSFDLHRTEPIISQFTEPTGTFGPVYLDDLDGTAVKNQVTTTDLSPHPITNGTASGPHEQSDSNSVETSPISNSSPSPGGDPADETPLSQSSTNLFLNETKEPQQNENNNNPSICSSDPFVEINLDEAAWCDQLLTSPTASSSVLPFSTLSSSSSSSSSS